jgi:hypothetical protein
MGVTHDHAIVFCDEMGVGFIPTMSQVKKYVFTHWWYAITI